MPDYGKPIDNNLHWKSTLDFFKEDVGEQPSTGGKEPAWKKHNPMWANNPEAENLNIENDDDGLLDMARAAASKVGLGRKQAPVPTRRSRREYRADIPKPVTAQEDMAAKMQAAINAKRAQKSLEQSYPYPSVEASLLKLMKEYPDAGMSDEEWEDVMREYNMGQQEGPRAEGTVQGTPKQLEEEPMSTQRSAAGVKVSGVPEDLVDNPADFPESHKLHGPDIDSFKNSLLKLMKEEDLEKINVGQSVRGFGRGLRNRKWKTEDILSREERQNTPRLRSDAAKQAEERHVSDHYRNNPDEARGERAGKATRQSPMHIAERSASELNPELLEDMARGAGAGIKAGGKAVRDFFQPESKYTPPSKPGIGEPTVDHIPYEYQSPKEQNRLDLAHQSRIAGLRGQQENRRMAEDPSRQTRGVGPMELSRLEKSLLKLMKEDKPRFRATTRPPEHMGSSEEPITYKPLPDPETGEAAGSPAEANDLPIYEPPRPKGKLKYPSGYSIEDTLLKLMKGGDEQPLNAMDKGSLPKENKESQALVANGDSKRPKSEVGTNDKMFKKAEYNPHWPWQAGEGPKPQGSKRAEEMKRIYQQRLINRRMAPDEHPSQSKDDAAQQRAWGDKIPMEEAILKLMKEGEITPSKVGMPKKASRNLDKVVQSNQNMASTPTWRTSSEIADANQYQPDDPSKWSAQGVADIIGRDVYGLFDRGKDKEQYDSSQPHQSATQNAQTQAQAQATQQPKATKQPSGLV